MLVVFGGGADFVEKVGAVKAERIAVGKVTRRTREVPGMGRQKTGSNIAARYNASSGELQVLTTTLPSPGSFFGYFDRVPRLTPSTWRSIHHTPETRRMVHNKVRLRKVGRGRRR